MEQPGIAAIILAAGYSARMGRFKPLLDLGGQTVIERVIASFKGAGILDVRVVTGYCREILVPVIERLGATVIINDRYAEGMFSSVQAGVKSLGPSTGAFFLMPADVPLVRADTIRYLAENCHRHRDKILVPLFDGRRGHPTLIAARFAGEIINYRGEGGLGGILSMHSADIVPVTVADAGILLDMDTPGHYAGLQQKLQQIDEGVLL
jgi:molybdenum cofactor cytidylyltransferase